MTKIWVQLKGQIQYIQDKSGKSRAYSPGDWVEVNRGVARRLIANGLAWIPERTQRDALIVGGCGAVIVNGYDGVEEVLAKQLDGLKAVRRDRPALEFHRTMLWSPDLHLRDGKMALGFSLLDRWQIAVPLCDYDTLALHVGEDEDRAKTQELISDLRVPVYDTRLMFVRRCPDTRRLFEIWQDELGDERLAFLRAVHQVKPLILALPTTWTE